MVNPTVWIYLITILVSGLVIYVTLKWRQNKPLIQHFRSSTIWKAFVLNSIAATLIIFIAITTHNTFNNYFIDHEDDTTNDDNKTTKVISKTNLLSILFTLTSTFMISMVAYTILYVLFGFGGGMIIIH